MDSIEKGLIKILLDTSPIDKRKAGNAVRKMYKFLGFKTPKIIYCESPFEFGDENQEIDFHKSEFFNKVWSIIKNSTSDVAVSTEIKLWQYSIEIIKLINPFSGMLKYNMMFGSLDLCKEYEFLYKKFLCSKNLNKETKQFYKIYLEIAKNCFATYPTENLCLISDRPKIINFNNNHQLHNDGKPAAEFRCGTKFWYLNGVKVPNDIVTTPWNKLDPKLILSTKNAEVRREIVRKVGIERICKELNAEIIDKRGNYELLNLDIPSINGIGMMRPYLKMINPSIGTYHIEGVHPNCKTVKQALEWRNGIKIKPEVLT